MHKLQRNEWIFDENVFNTIGQDIIRRWNEGDGSWLDLVDSDYKKESYFLDFSIIKTQEDLLSRSFECVKTELPMSWTLSHVWLCLTPYIVRK